MTPANSWLNFQSNMWRRAGQQLPSSLARIFSARTRIWGGKLTPQEPRLGIRVFESRDRVVEYDVGHTRFQKVVRRLGKGEIVRRRQGAHGVA